METLSIMRGVLLIEGFAPYDQAHQCFVGGSIFQNISVYWADIIYNETLLTVNGSGFFENCPSMSGAIFTDITNAVIQSWK